MTWRGSKRGPVCIVPACRRSPAEGQRICAACWRYVPVETRLAIDGHNDAWRRPSVWIAEDVDGQPCFTNRETWNAFVLHSWAVLEEFAAQQAYVMRVNPAVLDL